MWMWIIEQFFFKPSRQFPVKWNTTLQRRSKLKQSFDKEVRFYPNSSKFRLILHPTVQVSGFTSFHYLQRFAFRRRLVLVQAQRVILFVLRGEIICICGEFYAPFNWLKSQHAQTLQQIAKCKIIWRMYITIEIRIPWMTALLWINLAILKYCLLRRQSKQTADLFTTLFIRQGCIPIQSDCVTFVWK